MRIWTIGHSTRTADEFRGLIVAHKIKTLADVRASPSSRRFPQFNQKQLSEQLSRAGIVYRHLAALGGRRSPVQNSKNTAWRNASFRAYADHMGSPLFEAGIEELLELAEYSASAIMCAESLWWKCHRSLIADYLKAHGHEVVHILSTDKTELHPYTSAARIVNGELSYAGLLPEE
jgi:uncharacterized protein (DUF488 family)